MKLLVMRHGEATPPVEKDASRALTTRGHAQARAAAEHVLLRLMSNGEVQPEILLASPYLRAQETAMEVQVLLPEVNIETAEYLTPEASPVKLIDYLKLRSERCVMLVSHQPLVSLLIEYTTGQQIGMDTANVVFIETEFNAGQRGELKWFI